MLLYLDMQRGLSEFSGHGLQSPTENLKDLFVNGKILTESNLSQYNSSEKHSGDKTYFSFADSHLEAKKRLTAILLAKKLYADAGRAYDAESDRPVEMKAGEADRDFVYMQDMSFLDEDVDWIVARAEAVAYRLANSYDKKAVGDAELERRAKAEERSFQNSHIVEACVRDALEKREKALNVRERLKAKEKTEYLGGEECERLYVLGESLKEDMKYFGYGYLKDKSQAVPYIPVCFWAFRVMVGLGVVFIAFFAAVLFFAFRRDISRPRWLHMAALAMLPLGYVASEAGWVVAEMGRQPWAIQDMMPTWVGVSDIGSANVMVTFFIFLALFSTLLAVEVNILRKQIKRGPEESLDETKAQS